MFCKGCICGIHPLLVEFVQPCDYLLLRLLSWKPAWNVSTANAVRRTSSEERVTSELYVLRVFWTHYFIANLTASESSFSFLWCLLFLLSFSSREIENHLHQHRELFLPSAKPFLTCVNLNFVQAFSSCVLRPENDPVSVEAGQHPPAFAPLPAEPPAGHDVFIRRPRQQPVQLHGQQRRGLRGAGVSCFCRRLVCGYYMYLRRQEEDKVWKVFCQNSSLRRLKHWSMKVVDWKTVKWCQTCPLVFCLCRLYCWQKMARLQLIFYIHTFRDEMFAVQDELKRWNTGEFHQRICIQSHLSDTIQPPVQTIFDWLKRPVLVSALITGLLQGFWPTGPHCQVWGWILLASNYVPASQIANNSFRHNGVSWGGIITATTSFFTQ